MAKCFDNKRELVVGCASKQTVMCLLEKAIHAFPQITFNYEVSTIKCVRLVESQYYEPFFVKHTYKDYYRWLVCKPCITNETLQNLNYAKELNDFERETELFNQAFNMLKIRVPRESIKMTKEFNGFFIKDNREVILCKPCLELHINPTGWIPYSRHFKLAKRFLMAAGCERPQFKRGDRIFHISDDINEEDAWKSDIKIPGRLNQYSIGEDGDDGDDVFYSAEDNSIDSENDILVEHA